MTWLNDLFLFLVVPGLVVFAAVISYRGPACRYKIVQETNTLGETRYEIWFEYQRWCSKNTWQLEETFDTPEQADQHIARQFTTRETVREGKLP